MEKLSEEEFKKKYSEYLRKKRAMCKTWCSIYNTDDQDCEIYGVHKCTPSTCFYFLDYAYADYLKGSEFEFIGDNK